MKRIFCLLLLTTLFFLTANLQHAFAIGRRPKKEAGSYSTPKAPKKPIPPPQTRDMQIATGEIKPVNPEEPYEGEGN